MKIAVCIKQVPDSNEVRMSETGLLIREGFKTKINPSDLSALEAALQIKQKKDEIFAFSMGPLKALEIIKYSFSLGIDRGILLSDKLFAGSDVYATAYILATALKSYDLIICGQESTDGDTGQVGPSISTHLDIPHILNVCEFIKVSDNSIILKQNLNNEIITSKVKLPVVLIINKESFKPRFPTLKLKIAASKKEITIFDNKDLLCDERRIGLLGSPTRVKKINIAHVERNDNIIKSEVGEASNLIYDLIVSKNYE